MPPCPLNPVLLALYLAIVSLQKTFFTIDPSHLYRQTHGHRRVSSASQPSLSSNHPDHYTPTNSHGRPRTRPGHDTASVSTSLVVVIVLCVSRPLFCARLRNNQRPSSFPSLVVCRSRHTHSPPFPTARLTMQQWEKDSDTTISVIMPSPVHLHNLLPPCTPQQMDDQRRRPNPRPRRQHQHQRQQQQQQSWGAARIWQW